MSLSLSHSLSLSLSRARGIEGMPLRHAYARSAQHAAELAVNLGCMLCMGWDSIGCIQARLAEVLVLFGHVERALEYAKAAQPRNRPRHFARRSSLGLLCLRSACHGAAP